MKQYGQGPASPRNINNNDIDFEEDLADIAKHGDVITRSTLYSNVKCPHCDRNFNDKAA